MKKPLKGKASNRSLSPRVSRERIESETTSLPSRSSVSPSAPILHFELHTSNFAAPSPCSPCLSGESPLSDSFSPTQHLALSTIHSTIGSRLGLRPYQRDAFGNRTNGLECWLWGRQTGKSFTLAAWAIDRLVTRPGRLVTILSNSLANGMELNQKCAEIARLYDVAFAEEGMHAQFETLNVEIRLNIPTEEGERVSRIKILPANPRTARGFSGDLILDEFAFHENGTAIWEAAEPILAANPDYLCRIASTPNGRHNMFYRLATDPRIPTRIVPRSLAWEQELIIAHPITRKPITPAEARALAVDKCAYDQNYECIFEAENMSLLTRDLISQAEDPSVGLICDDIWSPEALDLLAGSATVPRSSSQNGGANVPVSPNIAAPPLPSDAPDTSHFALRIYLQAEIRSSSLKTS